MTKVVMNPESWSYYAKRNSSKVISMELVEISDDFQFSISDGKSMPSLVSNYYHVNSGIKQKYILKDLISLEANVLMVGFQNLKKKEVSFVLKFNEEVVEMKRAFSVYVYIVIGVSAVLVGSVGVGMYLCRQRQETRIVIPRRRTKSNQKKVGFKVQTILDHFPGYQYEMLIGKYASLGEMSECVVCLETMKPSAEYANIPTSLEEHQLMHCKDESVTSRARSGELFICSVTPCFHLFHTRCLYSWLQSNTYCPLCRQSFREEQIVASKPWVELGDELSSRMSNRNHNNKYIARMKTKVQDQLNPASQLLSSGVQSKNNSEYME